MKTVRIELARNPDKPDGDVQDSYELHAFLNPEGRAEISEENEQLMTFSRSRPGAPTAHGQIVRQQNGNWAFSYEAGEDDDEVIVGFESHQFQTGEYLTVVQNDDVEHVYRVVSVNDRYL